MSNTTHYNENTYIRYKNQTVRLQRGVEVQDTQLHMFFSLVLDRGKWFASRPSRFTLSMDWIGGKAGPPWRFSGCFKDKRKLFHARNWSMTPWSSSLQPCHCHRLVSDGTQGSLQWSTLASVTVCFPSWTQNSTLQCNMKHTLLRVPFEKHVIMEGIFLQLDRCDVLFCITVFLWRRAVW